MFEQPPREEVQETFNPQEMVESRELNRNDLLTSDSETNLAIIERVLKQNKVPTKLTRRSTPQKLNEEATAPGEFIITIFDLEGPSKPASFDYVKKIFELLKENNVAVQYGKNPQAQDAEKVT